MRGSRTPLLLVLVLSLCPAAQATKVTFRLVVKEDGERVLASDLRTYRSAPGGLVAVDWLGGVQAGDVSLFPKLPVILEQQKEKDEFFEELGKTDPSVAKQGTPKVDPLYEGRDIGYEFYRPSVREAELNGRDFVITPGDIRFSIEATGIRSKDPRLRVNQDGEIEIECVPVTLTAVIEGEERTHVPFTVDLTLNGRSLLAEVVYEPDEFYLAPKVKGPQASFVRLKLYLIPNQLGEKKFSPYHLSGVPFHVSGDGVTLADQTDKVTPSGKSGLAVRLPAPRALEPELVIPLFKLGPRFYHHLSVKFNPGDEWFYDSIPLTHRHVRQREIHFIAQRSSHRATTQTQFHLLGDFDHFPARAVAIENVRMTSEPPAVYVLAYDPVVKDNEVVLRLSATREEEDVLGGRESLPARLRKGHYDGKVEWTGAPILLERVAEPHVWQASLPEGCTGLVTLSFPEIIPPELWLEVPLVVVPQGCVGAVTLLTPQNRVHFQVGEVIEIHAAARASRPTRAQVKLSLQNDGTSSPLKEFLIVADPVGPNTATFQLDTSGLRPGYYLIAGEAGPLAVHAFGFRLYDKIPPTDYPSVTMKPFSHGTADRRIGYLRHLIGASPGEALGHVMPEERYVYERSGRLAPQCAPLLASNPLLPLPERTRGLTLLQQMFALGVTQNARYYWEPSEGYVQYNIKHTTDIDNARMYRLQQMYVQQSRGFPSFGGLANYWHAPVYGYWEGSPPVDGHQPIRNRKVRTDFEAATGMKAPTGDEIRALARRDGDEAALKDIRERLLPWRYWEASVLPKAFRAWHEAMDEIQPGLWLLNRPLSRWATGPSSYPPTFFGPLDAVSTYNITDFGQMPFDLPFGAALSGAGVHDRLKFIHSWTWSRPAALKGALLALTLGADGVDPSSNEFLSHNLLGRFATYDRRQVMEILERYGNFIRRLPRYKDIAVLFSVRQAWGEYDRTHENRVQSLFYDLIRSRRSVTILLDEDLPKGKLKGHKALFLLGMTCQRPEPEMQVLRDLEASGGVIFRDEDTSDLYPGRRVEIWKDAPPGYPRGDGEYEFVKTWQDYEKRKAPLEAALKQIPAPFAETDSPHRLLGFKEGPHLKFVAVINDEFVPFDIPGRYRQLFSVPTKSPVRFDQQYTIYDLLEGDTLRNTQSSDVDFGRCEARLLVLTRRPLKSLALTVQHREWQKGTFEISASVTDDSGMEISDPVPYELIVRAPDGRERWRLLRTLAPSESTSVALASNDPRGEWKVQANELISGLTASTAFVLEPGPKLVPQVEQLPGVLVSDRAAVTRFFNRRERLRILLAPSQEALMPLARRLAQACTEAGRPTEVRVVQPDDVHVVPLRWRRTQRDQKLWAAMEAGEAIGYRHGLRTTVDPKQEVDYARPTSGFRDPGPQHLVFDDLVLVGMPGENRFLDEALTLAPRQPSGNYPGPGRALLQHVWSPFWARKHVVTVSASDEQGLSAGVGVLIKLIKQDSPVPTVPDHVARQLKTIGSASSETATPLPRFLSDRLGQPIVSLSVSPDGEFVGVGAQLYGPNLFLLDREGKILWKEHLNIVGPTEVTVTSGGERTYAVAGGQAYCFDRSGKGLLRMPIPPPSVSANQWHAGPTTLLIHSQSQDFFVGGKRTVRRIGSDGQTRWEYSDLPWCHEALDFHYHRGAFLKALSLDGKRVLAAVFGTTIGQLGYLNSYWKPGLIMFDTETGKPLWRHQGLIVNNTMAAIRGDRTVVYDDDAYLNVFDAEGRRVRRFGFAPGLEAMELAGDGRTLVLRTAMARDHIQRPYGRSMHLTRLDLESGTAERYPTEGEIRDFRLSPDGNLLAASTWAGKLYLFELGRRKLWERDVPGGCLVRWHPAGAQIIAGTATGQVLWYDLEGNRVRELDLTPFNHPEGDFVKTVKDDNEVPELEIQPLSQELSSVFDRAQETVDFKLLPVGTVLGEPVRILDQAAETPAAACPANSTFIISFFVHAEQGWTGIPYDRLRVEVISGSRALYSASLPLARRPQERTLSFKTGARAERVRLRFTPERYKPFTVGLVASMGERTAKMKPITPFTIDKLTWAQARYRSRNYLKTRTADDMLQEGAIGTSEAGEVRGRIEIPNPYPATYQMPFITPRIGEITFMDGKITGQETSWARGNSVEANKIGDSANKVFWYAHLYLTLPQPRTIAAIAVYEDDSGPVPMQKAWQGSLLREKVARNYAVLVRDARTKKWRPFGSVQTNVNVFNLFTGEPVKADMIHYFWAGSGDWHIRLAEIEAYSNASDTEEDLGTIRDDGDAGSEEDEGLDFLE